MLVIIPNFLRRTASLVASCIRGDLLGKLAGLVAQPLVRQGVDPPLGCVRFSREVLVAHLDRYTFMMPLLLEIQYETVEMIPETANLLTWSEEGIPSLR
jgi:hypothetical protein